GRDSAFLLHLLGEWCLIAGRERNLLPWIKPTTGHVHVIHAAFFEFLRQDYGFLWRPATVDPVSAETRMPSGFCSGHTTRTASYISIAKRMRFSSEPPYSSMRWLESGERNWCARYP